MDDDGLNAREWQLYLVLKELQPYLTDEENKMELRSWIEKKVKELEKRGKRHPDRYLYASHKRGSSINGTE